MFLYTGTTDDGYVNDDDDTIDQDLSSLTSFDGLQVIGMEFEYMRKLSNFYLYIRPPAFVNIYQYAFIFGH